MSEPRRLAVDALAALWLLIVAVAYLGAQLLDALAGLARLGA